MNSYFTSLKEINVFSRNLLSGDYKALESPEIQQSAMALECNVKPCLEEVKSSAIRLNKLVQNCLNGLAKDKDVWSSKPKISEVSSTGVMEDLGTITGCHFKVRLLGSQHKSRAIEVAKESWNLRIDKLIEKYFYGVKGVKGQAKQGIGFAEKDRFNRELDSELISQAESLDDILKEGLYTILHEVESIEIEKVQNYIALFDEEQKLSLEQKFRRVHDEIRTKLDDPALSCSQISMIEIKSIFNKILEEWKKRLTTISLDEVAKFNESVAQIIERRIVLIFDDRVSLVTDALDELVDFYNTLLDRQKRYHQEMTMQHKAEKEWLDKQREELEKIQLALGEILG